MFYIARNRYSNMIWFYQVIGRTAKSVKLRRVCSNKSKGTPIENEWAYDEDDKTKRVGPDGRVSIDSWTSAHPWDGTPVNEHSPMWGHNYNLY